NNKSLPGYLNMGWKEFSGIPFFRIGVLYPYKKSLTLKHVEAEGICIGEDIQLNFQTSLNNEFLKWRYNSEEYKKVIFENDPSKFIVYKITNFKMITTIIVYEIFGIREN